MSRYVVVLLMSLLGLPGLPRVQAQAPTVPASAGYLHATFDLPNAAGLLGQTVATDLNENQPPQLTLSFNFYEHRQQQGALIVTPTLTVPLAVQLVHCPQPHLWTSLQGINRHRDSAGWCYREEANGAPQVQAMYRSAGGKITLIPIPGATSSEAADVNNFKHVTGSWMDSAGICHGFLWKAGTGKVTTFDAPFPGNVCTVPLVMNNADVIGGLYHSPLGTVHAFLYDFRANQWQDLAPPGSDVSAVVGLNDYNTALVTSDTLGQGSTTEVWHAGVFTPLPWPLPLEGPAHFHGLNNRGQLLGTHEAQITPDDPALPPQGFLRGVVATPLPASVAPVGSMVRAATGHVEARAFASTAVTTATTRAPLAWHGCPGDGLPRGGKLAMSWGLCLP